MYKIAKRHDSILYHILDALYAHSQPLTTITSMKGRHSFSITWQTSRRPTLDLYICALKNCFMNKTHHLPIRQRLKYVHPIWTIKHRRLCTVWENTSKKSSSGADNLVQRLTERIMNPRVGGGPQAIKVISALFSTQIIEVHLYYEVDSASTLPSRQLFFVR